MASQHISSHFVKWQNCVAMCQHCTPKFSVRIPILTLMAAVNI